MRKKNNPKHHPKRFTNTMVERENLNQAVVRMKMKYSIIIRIN